MRSSRSFFQRQKGTQRQHELRFQIKNLDKPDAERYLKSTNTAPNLIQRTTEPTTWRSTTGERFSLTFSTYSPRSYTGGEGWHTNWVNYFRASLPYHPPSHWKGMTNDRVALSFRNVCRLYDVEGENVVTELKVFHSSYALPPSNVKDVLKCLKDMMWNQFSLVWLCF